MQFLNHKKTAIFVPGNNYKNSFLRYLFVRDIQMILDYSKTAEGGFGKMQTNYSYSSANVINKKKNNFSNNSFV